MRKACFFLAQQIPKNRAQDPCLSTSTAAFSLYFCADLLTNLLGMYMVERSSEAKLSTQNDGITIYLKSNISCILEATLSSKIGDDEELRRLAALQHTMRILAESVGLVPHLIR